MNSLLVDLLATIKSTPRPVSEQAVIKAWNFADLAHSGQLRLSGEPFIMHPTAVAKILALWNMDATTIVAGLLHDTVEEGGATEEDLTTIFGPEVAQIVAGVTKTASIHLTGSIDEEFVENLRKMLLVMARDLRVVLVRLADRLHNMRTLKYLPPDKQLNNARETLEIFAPLAERLGMGEIKGELEDLAFPYAYPAEFELLHRQTQKLFSEGIKYITKFKRQLVSLLTPQIPACVINIRHKHIYSLFKKLQRPEIGGDLEKIHDLVAARIITDTDAECYVALGIIHGAFHPVPYLGISDFIANPKPNGYRSIHTKVFGPAGRIVEIQIRTHAMHEQAEMGVAAHWQYSQAKASGVSDSRLEAGQAFSPKNKLTWVKELLTWQTQITDNSEYFKTLKFDALAHRNLVFTPKGDVYDLPRDATPVDFAYALHTDLGHQVAGARVNGKLVSLNHLLGNGDVVELVIDRKRTRPSSDWLKFVVTTTARHEIQKKIKSSGMQ